MPTFRPGGHGDAEAVAAILAASPEAAQWQPADNPDQQLLVAEVEGRVAGFLVWRAIDSAESELLNLAVAPEFRRRGVARGLFKLFQERAATVIFLEVRESNMAARGLYNSLGFQEVGVRRQYYPKSLESAIVMKLHS